MKSSITVNILYKKTFSQWVRLKHKIIFLFYFNSDEEYIVPGEPDIKEKDNDEVDDNMSISSVESIVHINVSFMPYQAVSKHPDEEK